MDRTPGIRDRIKATSRERLLEGRIVVLDEPISEDSVTEIVSRLLYLQHEDRSSPIHLLVDSSGGSVVDGYALLDAIEVINLSTPVFTCCYGRADGLSAAIVAHGTRLHRVAIRSAQFALFLPDEFELPAADEVSDSRAIRTIAETISRDTGNSVHQVQNDLAAGRTFSAFAAKEYNLVDLVLDELPIEWPSPGDHNQR